MQGNSLKNIKTCIYILFLKNRIRFDDFELKN